ncbi:MAG TPA: hypothetical protein VGK64_19330 [Bryobacteraceae bacterium]
MTRQIPFGAIALLCFAIRAVAADLPDLQELRAKIAAQQEQIQRLQQAVNEQQKLLEQAIAAAPASATPVVTAASSAPVKLAPAAVRSKRDIVNLPRALQAPESKSSPLSISIGDSTFTPFGFMDFILYSRSTNVGSGLGTGFAGFPYNNSVGSHLSELNLSTANSRIGFRVDSAVKGAKVLGYFEMDFYGNQPVNVFQTSNSDTVRMRNVFVDIQKGKWEVMGGQDWSMFTPGKKSLSPLPSDIFYSQVVDLNYLSSLIWSRQSQFRVIVHPNEHWTAGLSLENPQQFIGNGIVLPAAFTSLTGTQLNNGASNYTVPNLHPDIIGKVALDQGRSHLEAGVLVRTFKIATGAGTPAMFTAHSTTAVSGEVNANFGLTQNVRLIANTFFGAGGGRYIGGTGPDLIVRADGSVSPVHSYAASGGLEINPSKNSLAYAYYSGAYFQKNVALDTNGAFVGYGFPGSPLSDNRSIQELSFGYAPTFWKNPNYGALGLNMQYSYLFRNPWQAPAGGPKSAHTNMVFLNLRYTLP